MDKLLKLLGGIIIVAGCIAALMLLGRNTHTVSLYVLLACIFSGSLYIGMGVIIELLKRQTYLLAKLAQEPTEQNGKKDNEENKDTADTDDTSEENDDTGSVIRFLLVILIPLIIICAYFILRNS